MTGSMLAIRFYKAGEIRAEQVPIPEPAAGELIVKNSVALTCGTDVKMYRRGHPLAKPPQIMGHEFAGIITSVGAGLEKFKPGMRVVSANSAPCNTCFYCLMRQPNLCEHLEESIIGFTWPGAYAQYVRIPARIVQQNTFEVPADTPLVNVASLEPLACVVHGWDLVGDMTGGIAAIIGGGPIGLLHAQLARLHGASQVAMIDISQERLREAEKIGVNVSLNSSAESPKDKLLELTEGRGADVVVEAVGRGETWESAPALVRKGGSVLLFGGCPSGTEVKFAADRIHYGELRVQGAFHHTPASVERAFKLIVSGRVSIKPILSHEMPLEKAEEALKLMGSGKALKVVLRPPRD